MKFSFSYRKKNFKIDVNVCNNIFSRARGLMFRRKSKPLLFIFENKNRQAIHSFFCRLFAAIWLDENRVIEVKIVKPWKISVKPKNSFNKLLEIPSDSEYFPIFSRRKNSHRRQKDLNTP